MDYCLILPRMERESEAMERRLQEARQGLLAVAKEVGLGEKMDST